MASKRPTFLQAFVITVCGALLFFFSCLGALSGMNSPPGAVIPMLGVAGLWLGGLVFLGGLVLVAVVVIRALVEAFSASRRDDERK